MAWLTRAACAAFLPATLAFVPDAGYSFEDFYKEFPRKYEKGSEEYVKRKGIFDANLREVMAHNQNPQATWRRGVNEYSDLTAAEFRTSGRLGYDKALAREYEATKPALRSATPSATAVSALPKSVDWREKGVISNVKDQGHCGSCWAFGSTETLESYAALATGLLPVLAPQQLVSCAPNTLQCGGVGGCQGSIPEVAFNYVQLYGMTTEWQMPYTSYSGANGKCLYNITADLKQQEITISGYQKLPPNDYNAVLHAVATIGPLAVNVQANTWRDYEGGVFNGCSNYSNVDLDHVVQLVGYGTDPHGGDYWLVRNSWDVTWGEAGYIRLKRSSTPKCGTDPTPLDGTGCKGGPATQEVCGECGVLFDASYPVGVQIPRRGHHAVVV